MSVRQTSKSETLHTREVDRHSAASNETNLDLKCVIKLIKMA